ncbi:MAG TPA: PAS domain-containing protein [Gemmatimonadaceae bacterium]|nr:PAS domain-containing protein [Gemmatimonadaceae bacterium]
MQASPAAPQSSPPPQAAQQPAQTTGPAPAAPDCPFTPPPFVSVNVLRALHCRDGRLAYLGDTVTIAGRVTMGAGDLTKRFTHLVVQDSTGGIVFRGSTESGFAAEAGDSVIARGVLVSQGGVLALEGVALSRFSVPRADPAPMFISMWSNLLARSDGRFVELRGKVTGRGGVREDRYLYLESEDDSTAHVTVEASNGPDRGLHLGRFAAGDVVRVDGVLLSEPVDQDSTRLAYVIRPSSSDAIQLVNPWHRRETAMLSLAVLALLAALGFGAWTRHRAAEDQRALVESRVWFTRLIEGTSEYMLLLDPKGNVIFASPTIERVLGKKPEELVGTNTFTSGQHNDDQEEVRAAFDRALVNPDTPQRAEYRMRHSDGHWVHLSGAMRNLLDDPVVRGMVVNVRDVSEERRIAAELQAAEKRYREMVDSIPLMVFSVEPTSPYAAIYVSRGHELLGLSREEWMEPGRWESAIHPDDRAWVLAEVGLAMELRTPTQLEYRAIDRSGNVRRVRHTGRFQYHPDGRAAAWNGVMQDVSAAVESSEARVESWGDGSREARVES